MSGRDRRRLERIAVLARTVTLTERELDRSLARASLAGFSLRRLEEATGIPRATLARRIEAQAERDRKRERAAGR